MPCQTRCTAWPCCVCERDCPGFSPRPVHLSAEEERPTPTVRILSEKGVRRIIREEIANATGEITDAVSREIGRRVARRRNG